MNQNQIMDLLQKLLVAGGPLAGLLSVKFGWSDSTIGLVFTLILTFAPPIVGIILGNRSNTDKSVVLAAGEVPGAKVNINPMAASADVVAVATDPTKPNVVIDPAKT